MRKIYVLLLTAVLLAAVANAQVTVTGADAATNAASPFATLAAAFTSINATAQTGNAILITITANTTEAAVVALPSAVLNGGAWTSISIQPSGGAWTISGAATAGQPLIDFNGADNVTVDGLNSGGNSLTISNTTVSATSGTSTIRFQADATNNTITRCSVLGSATMAVGTNGGNIWFGSAAVTTGNDNNIVSNCDLGPAGANLPSKCVYFSGSSNTDPGTANSGITITGNNIFDYFSATVATAGIDLNSGTVGTIISSNKFYQTATRTQTTGAQHSGIRISNASGNNYQITGNTIGFASSNGTGAYTFVGISSASTFVGINLSVGITTATSVQGNTIAGISMSGAVSGTSSSAAFRGIYVGSGLTTVGDITGNTIGNMSATGSIAYTSSSTSASDVIGIFNFGSSNWTTNNNNVGGIIASNSSTGAANVYGIRCNTGSGVTWACNNNTVGGNIANSLQSTSTATGSIVNGILNSNPIGTFTGNTVRNLTSAGGTGTGSGAAISGIISTSSAAQTISQNTISTLSATGASTVNGITLTSGSTVNIFKNKIYDLQVNNAAGLIVSGIAISAGTTVTTYNNLIGDLRSPATSSVDAIRGIGITSSSTNTTYNVSYNTVYLNASSTGANFGTSGMFHTSFAVATTATLNLRNNIIVNTSTPAGTGLTVAYRRNGGAANLLANYGSASNNNLFYAGTPGASNLIYSDGTSTAQTLAAYKAGVFTAGTVAPRDAASITENPNFLSTTGSSGNFLHINPAVATQIESVGAPVGSITDDYDGDVRNVTTPDIGADEFTGIAIDLSAPTITYTPLTFTCATGDRALNAVTISDLTGVPTVGANVPRVYYKKGIGGTYFSSPGTLATGTGISGTWNFTIIAADMGGLVAADQVFYYVIAEDIVGTPNVGSNPGAGLVATGVNAVGTHPTAPNSYSISGSLNGTYLVGTGQTYTTLTAAINSYNTSCLSGPVVFNLTDVSYSIGETFPITINSNPDASSTNTLTIKTTVANTTVSGSNATAIFILNGADYVTIDGSTSSTANTVCPASTASRDLTITNTNTGTTSAIVWLQTTAGADAATNNALKNCNLVGNSNTTTLLAAGTGGTTIASGTGANGNNNNSIVNNNISKVQIGIFTAGSAIGTKNNNNVINQNLMNTVSPDNIGRGGIMALFENNITISGNTISEIINNASTDIFGIAVGVNGISVTTIGGGETTNATVTNNTIGTVQQTNTFSSAGIAVQAATSGTTLIANNTLSGVNANGTSPDFAAGILLGGGTGSVTNVYHNTVTMTGTFTGGAYPSFALAIHGNTDPVIDLRNNIFTSTGSTGANLNRAIGIRSASFANLTSNNNDLFASGTSSAVGQTVTLDNVGTGHTALTDWQTNTGKDAASKNVLPVFTSATNLHLVTPNTTNFVNLESTGATVSVTSDIDCQARPNGSAPDIGADEFVGANPACPDVTGLVVSNITATTADLNWSAAGGGAIGYQYAITTSATPPGTGTSNGTTSVIGAGPLTPATSYYAHVRTDCGAGVFSTSWTTVPFTTPCVATNIPYLETFDGVTAPAVPVCVTVENVGSNTETWRTVSAPDDPVSAPNFMRLDYEQDFVTPANDWFFTQGLNLTGGTSYRLRFNFRNSDATTFIEKLEVKYGTGASAASMTLGTLFSNTNIDFNTWTDAPVIDFTPAITGVYYIGFHGFSDADQAFLCVDNVNVIVTPACEPPTNVSVGTITGSSAVVSFTSPGTNFIVEYGPIGFIPGTGAGAGGGTITTGTASPIAITGLAGGTTYDVYVRRDCGAGSYSPNTLPYSFTTGPANDDAPGALTLTVGSGCTGAIYTNANATAGSGEVFPSCSGVIQSPVWFKFVAPASGAVRVSTDMGSGNTFTDSKVGLFATSDVNDYTKFSIISCDEDGGSAIGSGFMSVVYATGLTPGSTYYIAVDRFSSGTSEGTFCIGVDELSSAMIAATNTCGGSYQTPFGSNATYTGWQPLVDASSRLVALVSNPAGGEVDDYSVSQNVNVAAVRTDATSGQRYLDRNFRIVNSTATNVNVQFFFLNSELTALQAVDPAANLANLGVTRQTETVPGCNANYAAANGTSSFLSQTLNGTVNGVSWIGTATPAFSNFYLHTSKAPVTVKTFLQGAYSAADLRHKNVTAAWATILNANALNQPYNVAPFNYTGTESVSGGFFVSTGGTADILDWVLLELRDATTPATVIARRAAFIREDGAIVDLDGISSVSFRAVANGSYFLAIRHRNHLGMRTSVVQLVDGSLGSNPAPALYDFTTSQAQAFDNPVVTTNDAMAQNGAVFMMWAGNVNGDDFVRVTTQALPPIPSDAAFILGTILGGNSNLTLAGYSVGDINMDGNVRATTQALPPIPSDVSFILSTPLVGNNNATRREHK